MKTSNQLFFTLTSILLLSSNLLYSQSIIPVFKIEKIKLKFPAFLPGIMADSSVATYKNDSLFYTLNGFMFKNNGYLVPIKTGKISIKSSSPWETIAEMANAYHNKDVNAISNLYSVNSKSKIEYILNGSQKEAFINYVSKAKNISIVGGFEYQNGFMVFTKDDTYGVHENYLIKVANQYKLEALDDKKATAWNVGLFLKFNPQQMFTDLHTSMPDSMKLFDTTTISCTVPETGRWVSVYSNQAYGPTLMLIQDNGQNDLDPAPGKVSFSFKGISLMNTGVKEIYIASFNFPVQRVSPSTVVNSAKHFIKIY